MGAQRLGIQAADRRLLLLPLGLLVGLMLAASFWTGTARAESVCTDTWTGPAEGEWATGSNWSEGHPPTSSDVACIGSGKTATLGFFQEGTAAVVQGKGTVGLAHGVLVVSSALEPSSIGALAVSGGTVKGGAAVHVTGSLTASESTTWVEGGSTLVVDEGASASIGASGTAHLTFEGSTFENKGTLTIATAGGILGNAGVHLINKGSLILNGEPSSSNRGLIASPGAATLVNTGTVEKTEGSGTSVIQFVTENEGTIGASSGTVELTGGGTSGSSHVGAWSTSGSGKIVFDDASSTTVLGATVPMSGSFEVLHGLVTAGRIEGGSASMTLDGEALARGRLEVSGGSASTFKTLTLGYGILKGSATVDVSETFSTVGGAKVGYLNGSGTLVLQAGASGSIGVASATSLSLEGWTLKNEGTLTVPKGAGIKGEAGADLINEGLLIVNGETKEENHGLIAAETPTATLINKGTLKKTEGAGNTPIEFITEDFGPVEETTGKFEFRQIVRGASLSSRYGGAGDPFAEGSPNPQCGDPVTCATGNLSENQTDLEIGELGVGRSIVRAYNAQAAAEGTKSIFGYGWSISYTDHLAKASGTVTLVQANEASVPFAESGATFSAPTWSNDKLTGSSETGYTLTTPDQTQWKFDGPTGRLEKVTDRNGNVIALNRGGGGLLEYVSGPAGGKLHFRYNGEGLVDEVEWDSGKEAVQIIKYAYEGGNLASVTLPGEGSPRWKFSYDGSHRLTHMFDGRGGETINEYDSSNRVVSQIDPAERHLTFEYAPLWTKITNANTGAVTFDQFNSNYEPVAITHGYGTASATRTSYAYNADGYETSETDGNGHTATYTYDAEDNRTSRRDPNGHETKWGYDSTRDVTSVETPREETTTIKRDEHGNATTIERPAPGETTQTTKYKYTAHGELEQVEDPLKHLWEYAYNSAGDRTSETDPDGKRRTWTYDGDGNVISSVSPRGNGEGAEPAKYTTKIERDKQERPIKVTDPLGHSTKYTYDGNGNLEKLTDANSHTTTYTYNADNQPTKVEQPNSDTTETEYDGDGQVIAQTDGNKHTTKYKRNILGQVTEVEDPLKHKTKKEYDAAGNLTKVTDAAERTTTYKYDPANQLTAVEYSEEATPSVKYEYDADGNRTKMEDGTGSSKYTYDQVDRLTETKDGHGNVVKYEYNLANQNTKITYPNGKAVTRKYDAAGRLETVEDWLEHTTTFTYGLDSELIRTIFPNNEDKYTYNEADQQTKTEMKKGAETLATLTYTPDNLGQLKTVVQTGLPGAEETKYSYDENNRLTKDGASEYKYDAADNPTTTPGSTNTYNESDELTKGTNLEYTYNNLGQRIKRTPSTGPATTYGYDQAGNLTKAERPKEDEVAEIKDSYAYDGTGLRASQTISGTTSYMTWNPVEGLPLLLSDGVDSYLYGPEGAPIEQINNTTGAVTYLHHDQAGSTRLLTGSTGTVTGECSYGAYGTPTCEGSSTTPLGYDGQYTSSDTRLIYLRARSYDPSTAQFVSRDPLAAISGEPYSYAGDNPLNSSDPMGLLFGISLPSWEEIGEGIAGWGDTITFGATNWVRHELGINNINACSGAYQGGGIAGLVTGVLIPGEGEAELGAEAVDEGIAGVIKGYTQHGLEQAIARDAGRGVSPTAILDAVRSPVSTSMQADGVTKYVGQNAIVFVNRDGQVVTTFARNSAGLRAQP